MSEGCQNCKEKHSLFTHILKARNIKLQRQERCIDRALQDKIAKIPELNPQRKFNFKKMSIDSLHHYPDSQLSIWKDETRTQAGRRPQEREPSPLKAQQNYQLREDQILNERARQFICRLRKQKEYNEGKLLLMRKRQEERRQLQHQLRNIQRKSLDLAYKKQRIAKMMDNILFHQERISERALNSLRKETRCKTQNSEAEDLSQSLNTVNECKIQAIKRRVKELSDLIDSYR